MQDLILQQIEVLAVLFVKPANNNIAQLITKTLILLSIGENNSMKEDHQVEASLVSIHLIKKCCNQMNKFRTEDKQIAAAIMLYHNRNTNRTHVLILMKMKSKKISQDVNHSTHLNSILNSNNSKIIKNLQYYTVLLHTAKKTKVSRPSADINHSNTAA